uniref:Lipoprotein n=1 Tax=Strongyloides papillosus TaxID=174720 RepID=A0A0N5CH69_STREA
MNKLLCIILFVLLTQGSCQDGSALMSRGVTRWKNYVSEFFEDNQVVGLFELALDLIYEEKNISTIGSSLTDYLMNNLTLSQTSKIAGFGLGLPVYYSGGISGFLDVFTTHISTNLSPFCMQLQGEMIKMKGKGDEKQYIYNQGTYMALTMFTPAKIEGIFCRFKKKMTPAVWSKLYNSVVKYKILKVELYEANCV